MDTGQVQVETSATATSLRKFPGTAIRVDQTRLFSTVEYIIQFLLHTHQVITVTTQTTHYVTVFSVYPVTTHSMYMAWCYHLHPFCILKMSKQHSLTLAHCNAYPHRSFAVVTRKPLNSLLFLSFLNFAFSNLSGVRTEVSAYSSSQGSPVLKSFDKMLHHIL